MRDNYGNLRRRTRDASWQWLMMGLILGIGFAAVVCVGGYALGGITFPLLEEDTSTPNVQIAPNETEVALQAALIAQQTLAAAQPTLPAITPTVDTQIAGQTPETIPAAVTNTPVPFTPQPTALPVSTEAATSLPVAGPGTTEPLPTQQAQVAAIQDTPVVGTPPIGAPTEAIGLPSAPAIPPELDALKTDMVTVDAATFQMGTTAEEAKLAMDECAQYGKSCTDMSMVSDSFPTHPVTVDRFEMEIYEVTLNQYITFLNWKGPNSHKTGCSGQPCAYTDQEREYSNISFNGTTYSVKNAEFYADRPTTYVTWWGAEAYCQALNRRLPTEAEWEHAARGRDGYIYPWGYEFDATKAMSSIDANKGTVPVSTYPNGTSPYGIYNMAGNVQEWVSDWYQVDYYTQISTGTAVVNPTGPAAGTERVLRGGSWDTIPIFLRTVHRMSAPPGEPTAAIGFRCVTNAAAAPAAPTNNSTSGTGSQTTSGGAPTLPPQPTSIPPTPQGTLAAE